MLDYLEIRKAHAAGESIRSIAARLGHCHKSVKRAIRSQTGEPLPYTRTKAVGYPKLGPFVAIIGQILREDESAPRKQRHHAKRIYQRLKAEHGYEGSYYPVRRYVASLGHSNRETFMRLDHAPGRRMEFDFGQVAVDFADGRRTVDVLSGVWTYSNCPFLLALPSQRIESILEGMSRAFEFFGAVPREVWWDNPKAVAIEILRGRDRTLNPSYAALASHYRFDPLFCMPAKGQEKSDVERSVFALERRACTPVPKANDLADLNRQLLAFCIAERDRTVAHQSATIGVNFESEKPAALELAAHPFDACIKRSGLVDKYQTRSGFASAGDVPDQPLQRAAHDGIREGDDQGVRRPHRDRARGQGGGRAPARVRPARIVHRPAALRGGAGSQAGVAGPRPGDARLAIAPILRAIASDLQSSTGPAHRRAALHPRSATADAAPHGPHRPRHRHAAA